MGKDTDLVGKAQDTTFVLRLRYGVWGLGFKMTWMKDRYNNI
jgi:hypothetical protein